MRKKITSVLIFGGLFTFLLKPNIVLACANKEIQTALGCVPTDYTAFAKWVLGVIIPFASGVAFLVMAIGAIQILTSSGDPKKVQAGQETITSGITGLLFIILSLFLLRLIGVSILQIPGFGT